MNIRSSVESRTYLYCIFASKGPTLYVPFFCVTNVCIGRDLSFPNIFTVTPSSGGLILPAMICEEWIDALLSFYRFDRGLRDVYLSQITDESYDIVLALVHAQ